MEKDILSKQSQRLVTFLQSEQGMNIHEIVKFAGTTPAYLAAIVKGEKFFMEKHFEIMHRKNPKLFGEFASYLMKEVVSSLAERGENAVRGKVDPVMKKVCNFISGWLD